MRFLFSLLLPFARWIVLGEISYSKAPQEMKLRQKREFINMLVDHGERSGKNQKYMNKINLCSAKVDKEEQKCFQARHG